MKIISWNLNGLMATMNAGAISNLLEREPDIICFQEIRTTKEPNILNGYAHYWNHGEREGYSGTAILTRVAPLRVSNNFNGEYQDNEGRLMTMEFETFFLVNAYVPNSQKNLKRRAYRMRWDHALRDHVQNLLEEKPVIICGDFNVAREDIDIYEENMRQYWAEQGYASDERSDFETLLECGLHDVFRERNPRLRSYTWWSNRLNKRSENRGWRLDYFLVSDELLERITSMNHLSSFLGSDHCPIELEVLI